MKNTQAYDNNTSGANWQVLGDLELAFGSEADSAISSWLTEVLSPLDLQTDFLNKVLKSAQESAAHALQAEPVMALEHIHLLIFAPPDPRIKGLTWGFFRIEKVENALVDRDFPDHAIEFYLYVEGK